MGTESAAPDPTTYRLNPDEYHHIFQTKITPVELSLGVSQEHPRVLLLGGQTGAGKSVMKSVLTADARWDNAVEFGSDTLRVHHPAFQHLLETDADHAGFYTDLDARAWVEDAIDYCVERRYSVVFDSTLSRPPTAAAIVERFRQAGYIVEAAFVGAAPALSSMGVVARFLDSVDERGTGRYALNHDETYEGVVAVADWADRTAAFDTVTVYRRSGERLYYNETAEHAWAQPAGLKAAISTERSREWNEPEVRDFLATCTRARHLAETLTMRDVPLDPIWIDRLADAAHLATPLAGDLQSDVEQAVAALRAEAASRRAPASAVNDPDIQAGLAALTMSHPLATTDFDQPPDRGSSPPVNRVLAENDQAPDLGGRMRAMGGDLCGCDRSPRVVKDSCNLLQKAPIGGPTAV